MITPIQAIDFLLQLHNVTVNVEATYGNILIQVDSDTCYFEWIFNDGKSWLQKIYHDDYPSKIDTTSMNTTEIQNIITTLTTPPEESLPVWQVSYTYGCKPWSQWHCIEAKKMGKEPNTVYSGTDGVTSYLYTFIEDESRLIAFDKGGNLIQEYLKEKQK